jgi:hypothetical protein
LLAGKFPDPIRVVFTISEQHRLWKQGAKENRTQPIVVRLTWRESEMDRQAAASARYVLRECSDGWLPEGLQR